MTFVDNIRKKTRIPFWVMLYVLLCISGAFVLPGVSKQGSFVLLSICETALILFVMPVIGVNSMDSVMRRNEMMQFMPAGRNYKIAIGLIRRPLMIAIILCLIPGLSGVLLVETFGSVPTFLVIRTFFLTLTIAFFALAIGFYAATVCKNELSGAGLALIILALICTEPIWFGPVINLIPDASLLIQSSLIINPFVNVASTLNFDILRTDPFYEICPIGQLRFGYPPYWSAILFNLVCAALVLWRSITGIRRIIAPSA